MQSTTNCRGRIWLIGGTQESATLAAAIASTNLCCTISVTTASASYLYPVASNLQVWVGLLTANSIENFFQEQQIVAVLDASHPYAVEVSQLAIALCQKLQVPYLRYERPLVESGCSGTSLDSLATLLSGNYLSGQRVLLTIGYKPLHLFESWHKAATLFARILPSAIALTAALKAGFTQERLICLRPPISGNLEAALWQQWQISLVVTKASGTAGGEDIKRQVADQLGIPLIIINRPNITYPQQTSDLAFALDFCRRYSQVENCS